MKSLNILFMGRKKYAAEMLRWTYEKGQNIVAVVTDSHFPNSPTAQMAKTLSIPVISLQEAEKMVNDDKAKVDLVISYLYWKKIKEPLISSPRLGCINFHPAILPDWKGMAGYNIAILNKLKEWGATAHYVDHDIDTGEIIRVFRFSFDYRLETAQSLEKKTQQIQCDLYKSVMSDILKTGSRFVETIPNKGGTYISHRKMLEMMEVHPETDDVTLKVHAFWFPPYHGANISINGKTYTLVDEDILKQLKAPDQTANNC